MTSEQQQQQQQQQHRHHHQQRQRIITLAGFIHFLLLITTTATIWTETNAFVIKVQTPTHCTNILDHNELHEKKQSQHQIVNREKSKSKLRATAPTSSSNEHHNNNHHHHHHQYNKKNSNNGILSRTARESAVIVEWEPVSELQRRIEDGVYYDHFDPLLYSYGGNGETKGYDDDGHHRHEYNNHWSGFVKDDDDNNNNDNHHHHPYDSKNQQSDWKNQNNAKNTKDTTTTARNNDEYKHVESVFCGFTVTKEEMERLKSASPFDDPEEEEEESMYKGVSI